MMAIPVISFPPDLALVNNDHGVSDLIGQVEDEGAVLEQVLEQGQQVAAVHLTGVQQERAGQVAGPRMRTSWATTVSPRRVSVQLPPVSAARSTMTEPARMEAT